MGLALKVKKIKAIEINGQKWVKASDVSNLLLVFAEHEPSEGVKKLYRKAAESLKNVPLRRL